jgi:hypothetical protein
MAHRNNSRIRRSTRDQKDDFRGILMLIFAGIIVLGVTGLYFYNKSHVMEIDKRSLCPTSGATSVTALLIDATDNLSIQQKQAFSNAFQSLRESIPIHGRLDLYFIHSTQTSLLKPVVSLCNPGHGAEISSLVGNPKHAEKTWQEGFSQPLEREISQLLEASPEKESPILESIQSVVLTSLSEPSLQSKPKNLILVSDLMQHTQSLSLYRGATAIDGFLQSKTFERLKSDLRGINMSVWMLGRENALSRSKLADLWQRIFAEQGAQNAYFCVLVESNGCQNDR